MENKNNKYFVRYRLDNDTEDYIILDLSYAELNEDAIASKIRQSYKQTIGFIVFCRTFI